MHGVGNQAVVENGIYRWLYLEMDFTPWRNALLFFRERKRRESHNLDTFRRLLSQFAPDVVFIWGMWNLSHALPALAEAECPGRVVYRFAEYWPTLPSQYKLYWLAPGRRWYSRAPKWLVRQIALMLIGDDRRPALEFQHAICVSAATRQVLVDAGIPVANARIIHTGLDVEKYTNGKRPHRREESSEALRLLYAGRLTPQKGVETALEAMAELVVKRGMQRFRLTVAGDGEADYVAQLQGRTRQLGLDKHVSFLGRVPSDEMPQLMYASDVLLLPSTWPEPLARVVLEGMICGLVVVATPAGGTSEVVVDGWNGQLFAAGDSQALAEKLLTLAADEALRSRLARAGQQTVRERFTLPVMLDQVEGYLQTVVTTTPEPATEPVP
jgi:glycosyltransferase involved in cell wall biosynthesis